MNNNSNHKYFGPVVASAATAIATRHFLESQYFNKLKFRYKLSIVATPWIILGGAYYKYSKNKHTY